MIPEARHGLGLLDPRVVVAAGWALMALRRVRHQLDVGGLDDITVPPPPPLPMAARRGVVGVLRRRGATCLTSAAVLQRWDAAHGRYRAIVIGVTPPSEGFRAHAWLDGDPPCHGEGFQELLRRPAR